ncbi:hypothetical protein Cgig2_011816 [Carnegiea gigantea]|uniref:RRM domain-containing protein n=1 Tax=Carnegiea gigantea TaxID=171969 RepID=A0A9Q1JX15_9CARY|nr:hypothetical protein Cgig2_011816 [Carnegiea gigantea]
MKLRRRNNSVEHKEGLSGRQQERRPAKDHGARVTTDLLKYFGKSGIKYGFIKFAEIQEGLKVIEHLNGRIDSDCKLHIPKVKNVPNQDFSSHYKQALLSNLNDNGLEGQKSAEEAVDRRKMFMKIFWTTFPFQAISCGSSMEDDEEIYSSFRPFDDSLVMEFQFHEKSERCKLSNKDKKRRNKNSKSAQNLPTLLKLQKKF